MLVVNFCRLSDVKLTVSSVTFVSIWPELGRSTDSVAQTRFDVLETQQMQQ
jgi:hypothetical protein